VLQLVEQLADSSVLQLVEQQVVLVLPRLAVQQERRLVVPE
jgi:hypothetical protein